MPEAPPLPTQDEPVTVEADEEIEQIPDGISVGVFCDLPSERQAGDTVPTTPVLAVESSGSRPISLRTSPVSEGGMSRVEIVEGSEVLPKISAEPSCLPHLRPNRQRFKAAAKPVPRQVT